jgi:hypothetical protein
MRWTADQTVSSIIQQTPLELKPAGSGSPGGPPGRASVGGGPDAMALIDWIEPTSTMDAGQILISRLTPREAKVLEWRIDGILRNPTGLPNGKNKRKKLTAIQARRFRLSLIDATEHAAVWAANGPLVNRLRGPGRPPDNAVFLFIDDIVCACKMNGLEPGLRYVAGSESLPVQIFIALAPLLWPGSPRAPRKLFERWQRVRPSLIRE